MNNKYFYVFCFRFTQLCLAIVREEALKPLQFAKELLPSLLEMVSDSVPNVRITLAKTMYIYFSSESKYFIIYISYSTSRFP